MRISRIAISLVLLVALISTARAQDPLQRLDPGRFGPGTLIVAMEELERYKPSQAVQPVAALVGHQDTQVARTAAWLLRRMGRGADGVTSASNVLANADAEVASRISAAIALGELREAGSQSPLGSALTGDTDPEVRAAAARALGELHRPGSAAALSQALQQDTEPIVRGAAAAALGSVPDAAESHLAPGLHDSEPFVQLETVWALGRHAFAEAAGILRGKLQDNAADCRVQAAAAWALARIGDPLEVEALQAAVNQSRCKLTVQAASWALTQLNP
jgi:HEAT repeat protein